MDIQIDVYCHRFCLYHIYEQAWNVIISDNLKKKIEKLELAIDKLQWSDGYHTSYPAWHDALTYGLARWDIEICCHVIH